MVRVFADLPRSLPRSPYPPGPRLPWPSSTARSRSSSRWLDITAYEVAKEVALGRPVGTVLGAATGVYNQVRSAESASRALRDDYAALCFGSVCYEMLHTTALAMDEGSTARVARENLEDFPPIILVISERMPSVLVKELADERKIRPDDSIATMAARNTRAAWSGASSAHGVRPGPTSPARRERWMRC